MTHGSRHEVGLINRRIDTRPIAGGDGFLAKAALKPRGYRFHCAGGLWRGEWQSRADFGDGRTLSLTAGQHIEEAEEW